MSAIFYLDHAATTPLHPDVLRSSQPFLTERFANPSSIYDLGLENTRAIKAAREQLATCFQVSPKGIVFCASATESIYLALWGCAFSPRIKGRQILISAIEHPAVIAAAEFLQAQGFTLDRIRATPAGILDLEHCEALLSENTCLVSCIAVNNEIGTLQPLEALGQLIKKKNPRTLLHVDATQAPGKIILPIQSAGIDLFSFSGHKLGAPRGIGALVMTRELPLVPVLTGGGQEHGWRGGTENVFGIVALGEAVRRIMAQAETHYGHMRSYRQTWIEFLQKEYPFIQIYDSPYVVPYYLNLAIPPIPSEVFLHHLEAQHIYVSTGSACSSKKTRSSHVWKALGMKESLARCMIRLSFAAENLTENQTELFARFSKTIQTLQPLFRKFQ